VKLPRSYDKFKEERGIQARFDSYGARRADVCWANDERYATTLP